MSVNRSSNLSLPLGVEKTQNALIYEKYPLKVNDRLLKDYDLLAIKYHP